MTCNCGFGELAAGRLPSGQVKSEIEDLTDEYMQILDIQTRPHVRIQDNLSSKWLGKNVWDLGQPSNTTILIQKRITGDPRTLERTFAHEMIHHADVMELDVARARSMLRLGVKPIGHGRDFLTKAKKVNELKGDDFVTVYSDQEYTQETKRQFLLFIQPIEGGRFGYAWAARLGPVNKKCVQRSIDFRDAVLVKTNDLKWTRGHKLKKCELVGIPRSDEDQAELRAFYEKAREAEA